MSPSPNKLLASLSANEYKRVASRLHTVHVSSGTALAFCGRTRVYFPGTGVCSISSRMADGRVIEVASVGSEGIVGLPVISEDIDEATTYLHLTHGTVQYMTMAIFDQLADNSEFGQKIQRYCGQFLSSTMQLVACNRLHSIDARCARWILSTYDRLGRAKFELTRRFLARALGIRQEDLAPIMHALAERSIIAYDAHSITIVDPIGLKRLACSCYKAMKKSAIAEASHVSAVALEPEAPDRGPSNVLRMRNVNVCTLCGLVRDAPHKTHSACVKAIDAELRLIMDRARHLTRQRVVLTSQHMRTFDQFSQRRES